MTTAYQHRPLSKIIAQPNDDNDETLTKETPPRDQQGRFTKAVEQTEDAPELPEKYRGKTAQEIVEMHQNSERRLGQLQNEVGQLRGLVQDLAQVQRVASPPMEEPRDVDLTGDDLLTDPVGSIRKVVQSQQPRQEPAPDPTAEIDVKVETGALYSDFPDLDEIVLSEGFQEYANRTASRQRDVQLAAQNNGLEAIAAARRLLEGYQDYQEYAQRPAEEEKPAPRDPVAEARAVANEPGHARAVSPQNTIHESDVIAMINSDPEKYRSPSFQKELLAAIREGRYIRQS